MEINVAAVAAELGEPVERVIRTLVLCNIEHAWNHDTDERFVTPAVREQLISIYENTRRAQAPKPTPYNLREEFDQSEREFITYAYGRPEIIA